MMTLPIGYYFERFLNWLVTHCADFTRWCSANIDACVDWLSNLFCAPPEWVMMLIFAAMIYVISKRKLLTAGAIAGMYVIICLRLWDDAMDTMALVIICTAVVIVIGLPLGILMTFSGILKRVVMPLLDIMQTMPAYVYLVPAIAFFSISNTAGVFATVIFALPPIVRMTVIGIEETPPELMECSEAYGATPWERLRDLQLPMALTSIRAGLNQTVMLALSMVVIASLVGAKGIGSVVWGAICNGEKGVAFEGGLAIVIIAIILDRTLQAAGDKRQK